jgi:hypothetical protein
VEEQKETYIEIQTKEFERRTKVEELVERAKVTLLVAIQDACEDYQTTFSTSKTKKERKRDSKAHVAAVKKATKTF